MHRATAIAVPPRSGRAGASSSLKRRRVTLPASGLRRRQGKDYAMPTQRMPAHEHAFSHDDLRLYLDTIGAIPLLSAAEEVTLAKQIAHGDRDQQHAARAQLTQANLRLVVSIAK